MSLASIISPYLPIPTLTLLKRVKASPLGYRLAHGAFWSMAGAVISRGLMLLASVFVARILGSHVYGEYGIIRSTVNMFLVFAGFGLGLTATKHVAEFRESDPDRAGRIIAISSLFAMFTGLVVLVLLLLFADVLAAKILNAPYLAGLLRIGGIILFINALNGAQTGALAGFEAFKTIAYVNLGVGLTSFPLLIGGAYWGGLEGAVWALGINTGINWLLNHFALRKQIKHYEIPYTFKHCTREWPILWRFSLPAALSGIMVSPVLWACNAFLVNQPSGYEQMGIFDAAHQWRMAILFVPVTVSQIVLPMLANLNDHGNNNEYKKVLRYNLLINTVAASTATLVICLCSPWIMASYGKGFEHSGWVLTILAFSSVLMAINSVVGQAIASKGKMWVGLLFNGLWGLALLAIGLLLMRQGYGALGLAMANLIAYLLHSIWQSIYISRKF
jgi:O-antigen/teichoic acid export membrane protein